MHKYKESTIRHNQVQESTKKYKVGTGTRREYNKLKKAKKPVIEIIDQEERTGGNYHMMCAKPCTHCVDRFL
jgi:hypothetical protein